ncbi:pilus assembly protein PilP [Bacteriovoracales bacterium]|nr:pilus assembly protein PilP [Bacteriovoracales bacterium]
MRGLFLAVFILATSNVFAKNAQFEFFNGNKTKIKNPFRLRDPFKRKILSLKAKRGKYSAFLKGNFFSNLPSIDNVALNDIKIVGVLLGKKRRAMAKIRNGKDTYLLKEGMRLGLDNAEIKAILPGGIVVVEKIKNVYNQEEYLETIIPISSE